MALAAKITEGPPTDAATVAPAQATLRAEPGFPIVGIGASAGGFQAFKQLLSALPEKPGMAFVLVTHLDPAHHSMLRELLSGSTRMPVLTVKDGMRVEQNRVYVIPPNADMTIADSALHLTPRKAGERTAAVDKFLRSLAEDQPTNAIGVILSGMGHDGSLGITAIKGEGGFTFAQDSDSAKYNAMPNSAVETGCVDLILPPEGIAAELGRIRNHPYVVRPPAETARGLGAAAEYGFARLFEILKKARGVDFSGYKRATIDRRILRRMALKQIETFTDYVRFLEGHSEEADALYKDFLIEVTRFFRNPEAFDSLKQVVYPALLKDREPNDPIRIWVPGCSTGEEAYSHAICLFEYLAEVRAEFAIQVFGTDVNESAIRKARTGIFKETISADVSPGRLRRFFTRTEDGYRVSKSIRDVCVFARQNVLNDPPFSRMDIVSCRNLLIYLGPEMQRRLVPILHYALRPNGFLMLGSTEGLIGSGAELFEISDSRNRIYRKTAVHSAAKFGLAVDSVERAGTQIAGLVPIPSLPAEIPEKLLEKADQCLIEKYAPAAVVVNEKLDIVHARGAVGRYLHLHRGKVPLNLQSVLAPGLMAELRASFRTACKTGRVVCRKQLRVKKAGRWRMATIEVAPFRTVAQGGPMYLIVFTERTGPARQRKPRSMAAFRTPAHLASRQEAPRLKEDLAASKEHLQAEVEKSEAENERLQVANEEIHSANEELQSTNEELQISKEELESSNAELNSVNEELQHRNQQLSLLANDLANLFDSINIAVVMLDRELRVKRFTRMAEKMLGLQASDQGRPIANLKLKIESSVLAKNSLRVMRDSASQQFSTSDADGVDRMVRISPCCNSENEITGVVLTLASQPEEHEMAAGR